MTSDGTEQSQSPLELWLEQHQLLRLLPLFQLHAIDMDVLAELNAEDLAELGLPLGDRKRVLKALQIEGPTLTPVTPIKPSHPAERRQVTVVFCDLAGSSKLTASLDPEESRTIIREYRGIVAEHITGLGGHIAQFLGDGVLAYFGWPTAYEDSAIRAVKAALELATAVSQHRTKQNITLAVRVGIATGMVVVGAGDANPLTEDQTAVGDVVNIAARLQEVAEHGCVAIAESTLSLIGSHFNATPKGVQILKGVGAVKVFIVAAKDASVDQHHTVPSLNSPTLFGRVPEMQLAKSRWQKALNREIQTVLITGEPGIGKSHLTTQLVQSFAAEAGSIIRYVCSPFQQSTALHPIINELRATVGFVNGETVTQSITKLEDYVLQVGGDPASCLPYLARLLALSPQDHSELDGITPMIRKARSFAALTSLIVSRATQKPVLIVVEDAHWLDPTTLEFLDQLIAGTHTLPVMLLINARPEFRPPWQGSANFTLISLQRLSDEQVAAIIADICARRALPAEIIRRITERSDGIPLFAEELCKAVLESGQLRETNGKLELAHPASSFSVPHSLRDTLMARLDRHPEAREVAQIAACMGRDCDYEILAAISKRGQAELNDALTKLGKSEIIFHLGQAPQSIYTFKHALVQEAAKESLLNSKRRQIHLQIANYLEANRPDFVTAKPELMAYQLTEAQAFERAIFYRQQAGNLALASSGNQEAIGEFKSALELITLLPQSEARDRLELDILITQAIPYTLIKGYAAPEVEAVYKRAMETCARLAEDAQSFAVIYGFWRFYLLRADYTNAQNLSDQLVRMAASDGDLATAVTSNRAAGATRFYTGNFESALEHLGQTASIVPLPALRKTILAYDVVDPWVVNHAYSGMALWISGNPTEAKRQNDLAVSLAREINHPFTLALALCFAQWTYQFCGDHTRVRELASEAIALSERYSFTFWTGWAKILLAWAEAGTDTANTKLRIRAGLELWQSTGSELGQSYFQCLFAENSQGTEALLLLDAAEKFASERDENFWLPEIHRLRGKHILSEAYDNAEVQAEALFRKALTAADKLNAKSLALRSAIELAKLLDRRSDPVAALAVLTRHTEHFTPQDNFADLNIARGALARANKNLSLFDEVPNP